MNRTRQAPDSQRDEYSLPSPLGSIPLVARSLHSLSISELFSEEARLDTLRQNLRKTIESLSADESEQAQELVESLWSYYRKQETYWLQVRKRILCRK